MSEDLTTILADTDLLESPRVVHAIEDFIVEAIEEGTEILRHGDMASRTQLIRLILSLALKAKDQSTSADAEKILAQTRDTIAGIME